MSLVLDQVQVHTTRLNDRIMAAIPDLRLQTEGSDILLIYDEDIVTAVKQACTDDCDSDALILAKASNIIRRDVFELTQSNGRFPVDCQEDKPLSHGAKTISQLIVFNSIRASKYHVPSTHRHNRDRETPAPIYLALKRHGETRKKGLVDTLHNMGLCISYDRLLGISNDISNKVCAMYDKEGVVCPQRFP